MRNDRDLYPQEEDKLTLSGAVILVASILLAIAFIVLVSRGPSIEVVLPVVN